MERAARHFNAGPVDGYFNVGYRYHISNGGSYTNRYNLNGEGSAQLDSSLIMSHLNQEGHQTHRGGGIFARGGLNFRVAEGHTIGVSGSGMVSDPKVFKMSNTTNRTYLLMNATGDTLRQYNRNQLATGSHPGGNATLDYTFEMDEHKLYVSGTYNHFGFNMLTNYQQEEKDKNPLYQNQNSESLEQGIEVKAEYEWKPTPQSRLEAGYNYTRNWGTSFADAYNTRPDGSYTDADELFPYYTTFNGLNQNHAFYVTYGNRFWDKLSIQVGLRGEYYTRHLESTYKDDAGNIHDAYENYPGKKDTAYFQVYPSAYISYDF